MKLEGMVGGGRDKRERRDLERRVGRWRERERCRWEEIFLFLGLLLYLCERE